MGVEVVQKRGGPTATIKTEQIRLKVFPRGPELLREIEYIYPAGNSSCIMLVQEETTTLRPLNATGRKLTFPPCTQQTQSARAAIVLALRTRR